MLSNPKTEFFKNTQKSRMLLVIAGVLFFLALPAWVWLIAPQLTKLPADFSYTANAISLDNLYDEEKQDFSGDVRSVTSFSYNTQEVQDGRLLIANDFSVRSVAGDYIFSVERIYGIDRITREHVAGLGDRDRQGYLFAPKGLKKEESFTYWHINYDAPAKMEFVGEEVIFGLRVYHYKTQYDGETIDQTQNLTNVPGVGITRGVELEPHLEVWVEPVTGYLIKYSDKTTGYFYDLKTHERLHPWNKFSNNYQRFSIKQQVEIAQTLKLRYQLIDVVSPLCLFAGALLALFFHFSRKRIAIIFGIIALISLSGYVFLLASPSVNNTPMVIGIVHWPPLGNATYIDNIQGFKDALTKAGYEEGKDVVYTLEVTDSNADKVRAAARSFKEAGVNLIFSQTTPSTKILKEEISDIPIVFSIVTYPVESGIVNSLSRSGNNLVGTRNWVPVSEQLSNFLMIAPRISTIGFVHRAGESNSTIQFEEMKRAAEAVGVSVLEISAKNHPELQRVFDTAPAVDALFSACDTLVLGEAEGTIIAYAKAKKIPSFSCNITGPQKGDLIGTVADLYQIGKLSGEKAALILDGASPSALETNTVARPYIYINKTTAEYLGITIPQDLLSRAKGVIQ